MKQRDMNLIGSVDSGANHTLCVMQVVLSLSPGGTERLVIELVRFLHQNGIRSVVCCLDDRGGWADEVTTLGVPLVALRRRSGFRPGLGRAIAELAAQHHVNVVHCHHYSSFVYGQIAASFFAGPRVLFTEHGRLSDTPPSTKRRLVNPLLGLLPAAIYAVSADLREHMIREGFSRARVQVLHNGVHLGHEVTPATRGLARSRLGIGEDAVVVGTVGRLDPVKDLKTLLQAFGSMRQRVPEARLVVVGDGIDRPALQTEARHLGIETGVVFMGHREDVRDLIPAFDIFANSSIHEGVSLTILEAMAAALPIIATRVGGNPEVVTPETGILVPPRSVASLADALVELARDRPRRSALGAAARRRVETHFSALRMLRDYCACYHAHGLATGGR